MNRRNLIHALGAAGLGLAARHASAHDHDRPKGPLAGPLAHLCGIHVAKRDPRVQIITEHFCLNHQHHGQGGSLFQCLLFSCGPRPKLLGVEYIVSQEQYQALPAEEKKYWHPHTYEVLAGGLIMPGASPEDETRHLRSILHTWGKTWHTWPDPATDVPVGEPLLMWSLTGDGQADPEVVAQRDRQFQVSIDELRARRCREIPFEVPQVSFPTSIEQVGRQWTDEGDDAPRRTP